MSKYNKLLTDIRKIVREEIAMAMDDYEPSSTKVIENEAPKRKRRSRRNNERAEDDTNVSEGMRNKIREKLSRNNRLFDNDDLYEDESEDDSHLYRYETDSGNVSNVKKEEVLKFTKKDYSKLLD